MRENNWWGRLRCWFGVHAVVTYIGGRYGVGCICRRCREIVPVKHRRWR